MGSGKGHRQAVGGVIRGDERAGASRYCPRTADGPRPQHVGPLGRTATSQRFCAWPRAANRDGSRSAGGSAKCDLEEPDHAVRLDKNKRFHEGVRRICITD